MSWPRRAELPGAGLSVRQPGPGAPLGCSRGVSQAGDLQDETEANVARAGSGRPPAGTAQKAALPARLRCSGGVSVVTPSQPRPPPPPAPRLLKWPGGQGGVWNPHNPRKELKPTLLHPDRPSGPHARAASRPEAVS